MQYEDVQRQLEEIQRPRRLRSMGWRVFRVTLAVTAVTFGLAFLAGLLLGAWGFLFLMWLTFALFSVGSLVAWVLLVRARYTDLKIRRGL